ncbi:MAG TPA: LptF/LptG family permease [Candidatus Baltobacteraceae bacterium]|nr:LptF/LptG family permease [Candidatus Baltobacteraceae bacterium]
MNHGANGLKTLHKYLTRQVLASLALTVTVFTFVLLIGNVLKILTLLLGGAVGMRTILESIALLIPFVLVFALPIGFITATLLVFGRFSADQELTAARASGVSLLSLSMPILLLSLACCGLCAWINMDLGPRSRAAYNVVIDHAKNDLANIQLPEGRLIYDFPGYILYAAKSSEGNLKDVMVFQIKQNTTILASRGKVETDTAKKQLAITLYDVIRTTVLTNGASKQDSAGWLPVPIDLNSATNLNMKPKISDMSFRQLQQELREREQLLMLIPATTNSAVEWRAQIKATEKLIQQARSQMHEQIAFSFACFGFALVGIPLGIRVHRRETNIGIAMALILVMIYYSFVILGISLSSRPEFFPHLIFWIPNFIFQAAGAVLLWRANKGI